MIHGITPGLPGEHYKHNPPRCDLDRKWACLDMKETVFVESAPTYRDMGTVNQIDGDDGM
jgi:hypothetical protein